MNLTPDTIDFDNLKPGDVLLFKGSGALSEAIAALSGGRYSHAALFVGDRDGEPHVVDAARNGIHFVSLKERNDEEKFCDVYRWSKDNSNLNDDQARSVLAVGAAYEASETEYAFSTLYLCAVLLVAKELHLDKKYRIVMAIAAWLLDQWLEKGKTPVVCSELVYRCFKEARPSLQISGISQSVLHDVMPNLMATAVGGPGPIHSVLDSTLPSTEDLNSAAIEATKAAGYADLPDVLTKPQHDDIAFAKSQVRLLARFSPPEVRLSGVAAPSVANAFVIPEFVTPGDLQNASGLNPCIGRLRK